MNRPSIEHIDTVERAICIFRLRARSQPIARFRKEWARDIRHLREIRKFLLAEMYEPQFDNLRDEATHINP